MWQVPRTQLCTECWPCSRSTNSVPRRLASTYFMRGFVAVAAVMVVRFEDISQRHFATQFATLQIVSIDIHRPSAAAPPCPRVVHAQVRALHVQTSPSITNTSFHSYHRCCRNFFGCCQRSLPDSA